MARQVRQGGLGPAAEIFGRARLMNSADLVRGAPQDVAAPLLGAAWRARIARFDAMLGPVTEAPAAILVCVETIVLLAGVIARYVLQRPLIWSDEFAAVLFIWLAMLGAVIALRRSAHMRLTVLANLARPAVRNWLEVVSLATVALFVLLILYPAFEYTR